MTEQIELSPAESDDGIALANYQDIQKGDVIECFEVEEVARAL